MKALETKPLSSASTTRIDSLVRKIQSYQTEIAEHQQKLEKTRDQLRQSYARYTDLYELAPVAFLTLDKKARIRELNAKGASLLGFQRDWLIGRPFLVFIGKEDVPPFLNFLSCSTRSQQLETIEITLNVNSDRMPVHVSMKTTANEGMFLHCMTIVDLSAVKKNERELRASLENWLNVVRNAPDVILTVDNTGRILFANRSLWGHSAESLVDSFVADHIPERCRSTISQCINQAFDSGKAQSCEIVGSGEFAGSWYELNFGPARQLELNDNNLITTTTTTVQVRDITEEKQAKDKLRISGDQLREFAASLEAVREEERARVAREIHDELGQALTITKLDLSWLQTKPPQNQRALRKKVKSMMEHIDSTIERMRKIVSELRPSILDEFGLIAAIEWQVREFQKRTGIPTRLRSNVDEADLTAEPSAAVFRVVQEALTNVMRHANAKSVQVNLKKKDGQLTISISDDGKGINADAINDMKSLGIIGMRERIFRIGGKFNIHSTPGSGTRVEIVLGLKP
jgi:PAS domain S-box-containing protein